MDKTILITGASSGIGKATARFFHEKGWNVAATMRTPEKVADLPEDDRLRKFRLDVMEKDSIEQAVQGATEAFGRIDVLLNNAGYAVYGPLESAKDEQIRRQFDVNFFGLIDVTKAVLPGMRERGAGTIINVSSMGGRITTPLGSLYHGTKWALEGLTESLRFELDRLGIRVRLIEPGGVQTDFGGRSMDLAENEIPAYDPLVDKMQELMGGDENWPSQPEDIAKVIYKAATDSSGRLRYVAGRDAKLFLRVRSILGATTTQSVMKRLFGL